MSLPLKSSRGPATARSSETATDNRKNGNTSLRESGRRNPPLARSGDIIVLRMLAGNRNRRERSLCREKPTRQYIPAARQCPRRSAAFDDGRIGPPSLHRGEAAVERVRLHDRR